MTSLESDIEKYAGAPGLSDCDLPPVEEACRWPQKAMLDSDWNEAVRRWAVIRKAYPDNVLPWVQGAIAHMEAGELREADILLTYSRTRFPNAVNVLIQSVELALRRKLMDKANSLLTEVRNRFPDDIRTWIKSADYYSSKGDFSKALHCNEKARLGWPDLPAPFAQYAELAMKTEQWEIAAKRWEEMRKLFPDLAAGYKGGARAALKLNRPQEARMLKLALQYGEDILRKEIDQGLVAKTPTARSNVTNPLELIWTKAILNLKSEVERNYLSYSWWIIEPLLHMVVYYLVFGILLQRGGENFTVFLLTGLVPWMWFNKAVSNSSHSIIGGQQLMLQVGLPATLFPMISLLQTTLKQLPVFALLVVFIYLQGFSVGEQWWALIPVLFVQVLLTIVIASTVAAIIPFARDIGYLVPTGLTFLMFLSGIFYDYRTVSEDWQSIFLLNPMAFLLKCYREIFIEGLVPDMVMLSVWFAGLAVVCSLMFPAFKRLRYVYPRIVLE